MLKETDEIIISNGPSLSDLINHDIIPPLHCPDMNVSKDTQQGMLGSPLNYSSFFLTIML